MVNCASALRLLQGLVLCTADLTGYSTEAPQTPEPRLWKVRHCTIMLYLCRHQTAIERTFRSVACSTKVPPQAPHGRRAFLSFPDAVKRTRSRILRSTWASFPEPTDVASHTVVQTSTGVVDPKPALLASGTFRPRRVITPAYSYISLALP